MHKQALYTVPALPIATLAATAVLGQDKGIVDPKPLPPLANPNDPKLGAKELFGRKTFPAPLATHSIGFYAKGCLAGAQALPINGETWQVMRLSRNRNWAHPDLSPCWSDCPSKRTRSRVGPDCRGRQRNHQSQPRQ
jgi:penicillin-insensitive murein DD-endopeptidase